MASLSAPPTVSLEYTQLLQDQLSHASSMCSQLLQQQSTLLQALHQRIDTLPYVHDQLMQLQQYHQYLQVPHASCLVCSQFDAMESSLLMWALKNKGPHMLHKFRKFPFDVCFWNESLTFGIGVPETFAVYGGLKLEAFIIRTVDCSNINEPLK